MRPGISLCLIIVNFAQPHTYVEDTFYCNPFIQVSFCEKKIGGMLTMRNRRDRLHPQQEITTLHATAPERLLGDETSTPAVDYPFLVHLASLSIDRELLARYSCSVELCKGSSTSAVTVFSDGFMAFGR